MFNVSINSLSTNSFKQQQFDIPKKRAFINAVDTLDLEVNNCNEEYRATQKTLGICAAIFLSPIIVELIERLKTSNLTSLPSFKKFSLMLGATASSMLLFGLWNKKRADSLYKSNLLAQENAKTQLNNPKLFLNISDERQDCITNNPFYTYYNTKQNSEEYGILPDFKIIQHINFLQDINQEAKNYSPTADTSNEYSENLKEIDNRTQDYTKKITAGVNLLFAAGSLVLGGVFLALEKIKSQKVEKIFPIITLCSMLYASHVATNGFFSTVEKISRQKAKEDFINNTSNDKNFLQTTIEYLKTKGDYEQKVLRQKDLVPIKSSIITDFPANENEIEEAEKSQTEFFDAIKSEERMKNIKKNALNNSMSKDLIFNSLTVPAVFLLFQILENTTNKLHKPLLILYTLFAGAYAANTGLTLFLNTPPKKD